MKKRRKKPRNKKKGQKLPNRHPGVVGRLVKSFLKGKFFSTRRPKLLLEELFFAVFVMGTKERNILPVAMEIVRDGSPFESSSSPFGVKVCNCRSKGIYNCDCYRRYRDMYANWGYDSYRDRYFWGRNLYILSCVNGTNTLPIFLRFGQASRHDSVLASFSIVEALPLLHNYGFTADVFIGDSAHDATVFYTLLNHYGVKPIIDFRTEPKSDISLNEHGIPLCPNDNLMQYWGYEKRRNRYKWGCPKKAGPKSQRERVNCTNTCSNSNYGRTIYTKTY